MVQVPSIQNLLMKLDKSLKLMLLFSRPVSLIAVACQNRHVKTGLKTGKQTE